MRRRTANVLADGASTPRVFKTKPAVLDANLLAASAQVNQLE
jgi:hypothetical protein